MPYNVVETKNIQAANFGAMARWISVHNGDPGQTGANEIATTRQQTTWGAAVNGLITGTEVTLDIPAGSVVTHVSYWSAQSGDVIHDWVEPHVRRHPSLFEVLPELPPRQCRPVVLTHGPFPSLVISSNVPLHHARTWLRP